MNKAPPRKTRAQAKAERELAQLREQAEQARAALTRLQREVVEAEHLLDSSQSTRLLEANEQLVLAALHAQSDAEAASLALEELSRSADLDTLTALPNRVRLLDRFAGAAPMQSVMAPGWHCCSWTSTISSRSTTRSATPPAMTCSDWPRIVSCH